MQYLEIAQLQLQKENKITFFNDFQNKPFNVLQKELYIITKNNRQLYLEVPKESDNITHTLYNKVVLELKKQNSQNQYNELLQAFIIEQDIYRNLYDINIFLQLLVYIL